MFFRLHLVWIGLGIRHNMVSKKQPKYIHSYIIYYRMFTTFPKTKTYFAHLDVSPQSPQMLSLGKRIVLAIAEGARDISQLTVTLGPLQTLHAYKLRIDPTNFKVPIFFYNCLRQASHLINVILVVK